MSKYWTIFCDTEKTKYSMWEDDAPVVCPTDNTHILNGLYFHSVKRLLINSNDFKEIITTSYTNVMIFPTSSLLEFRQLKIVANTPSFTLRIKDVDTDTDILIQSFNATNGTEIFYSNYFSISFEEDHMIEVAVKKNSILDSNIHIYSLGVLGRSN